MASGSPSSRRQISATAAGVPAGQLETRGRGLRPLHEQAHRGAPLHVRGVPAGPDRWHRERRHRELVLTAEPQHRPAGHQRHHAGSGAQQLSHQRSRPHHLLEVVQYQHQPPGAQVRLQVGDQRAARGVQPQRGGDRRRHQLGRPDRAELNEPHPVRKARTQPLRDLHREPAFPDPAGAGKGHQAHALGTHQVAHRRGVIVAAHKRRRRRRHRPCQRRLARGAVPRRRHLEPLAQQHGQVVLDQALQLGGSGEVLVGHVTGIPDPGQHLRQPRLTLRRRRLHVDEPGQPRRQQVLILQPGNLFPRRDPAIALPVHAHEHLALRQVRAVYLARRVRPGAQLEHHRHQPQTGHRVPHCLPLSGQFLQRGTHKDPQPLVRRADHIRLGHHSTA